MTNVIKMQRFIGIEIENTPVCHTLDNGDVLISYERTPYAQEYSTHGLNKPNEDYEDYCERMAYHECHYGPRFPVPAPITRCVHHLNLIAAEPMQAWEDFKALGYHGGL